MSENWKSDLPLTQDLPAFPQNAMAEDDRPEKVAFRPFVGRIGGNQDFAVSKTTPGAKQILEKTPDAGYFLTWKESLDPKGFRNIELYKSALIEAWGTSMLTFITGALSVGLQPLVPKLTTGPLIPAAIGGVTTMIFLTLFIYSAGTVSGGHLNPLITIAVFTTRLATFPRAVIYVIFQMLGGTIGGYLIRAAFGTKSFALGGCVWDTSTMTQAEGYALEAVTSMTLLFLVFGVGLDPRQKEVFGPALAPILVGFATGVCLFATGVLRPGYTGASLNPARCFGSFVASENFPVYHWVHWLGPITGALINATFYFIVPPFQKG